jgi:lysozyme
MENSNEHIELVKEREGFRSSVYADTMNNPTIGYGHKIKKGEVFTTLTKEQAHELFLKDYQTAQRGANNIIKEFNIPVGDLTNVRDAITGAVFQLGETGFKKHKKTIEHLSAGNWEKAAEEAKNSLWNKQTPVRTEDFGNILLNKAKGGFINMQEGGEIGIPPGADLDPTIPDAENPIDALPDEETGFLAPDTTSEVLPNETLDETGVYTSPRITESVDTSEGFYSMNPAPNESIEDFENRTRVYTQPVETYELKTSSYTPPEDYVSPRISTSFADVFGYGGEGTGGIDLSRTTPIPKPDANTDRIKGVTDAIGTFSDAWTVYQIAQREKWDRLRGATASGTDIANFWSIDKLDPTTLTQDDVNIFKELQNTDQRYFFDEDFRTRVDSWVEETNELRLANDPNAELFSIEHGISWVGYQDVLSDIRNMTGIVSPESKFNVDWLTDYVPTDYIGPLNENQKFFTNDIEVSTGLDWLTDKDGNKLLAATDEQISIDPFDDANTKADAEKNSSINTAESWFNELGKQTLFTSDDHAFNVTLGSIADDAFVGLTTAFLTGDTEKGLIAAAGSFTATDIVDGAVNKVWRAGISEDLLPAFDSIIKQDFSFDNAAKQLLNPEEYKALKTHATNMNALMSSSVTMLTSLALGADMEEVLMDGAATAATILGTEFVGTKLLETFGSRAIEDYASSTIAGVGGGTLAAVIALIRTGDVKQAAISGLAGGLLAAGNPLGWAVMGVQLLMGLGQKPSNKSGYASFDFDKFEVNKYSQGDYDPSKGKPENVEFAESLLQPLVPYLQELEETTGFDFKGDLQIHYSEASGRGIYYTLSDIKQEGLSAKDMFLNRLDYFDGRDQSTQDGGKVYRRRFEATEEGIAQMYEALMADLAYIAENQISDIKYYTGVVKSQEQIQQEFKDSGFDIRTFRGIRQGGKISLDKGGNVQYNKGNYGLVNKKGKAPPSARADDVPMTLKEGDFVLSQPAVALYGKDTINRMLSRAATDAGKNLKSGGKVPVNVHNGEYIIPKNLTEYIGPNVLETMNNRGLMSVGERPNT